ncbi:MAG: glycosyltransferase family 39 protein [Verrucomicrobiota bacterium]
MTNRDIQIRNGHGLGLVILSGVALVIFTIIMTAPLDLMHGNEDRMAAFVQDAVRNGNWICPRDQFGNLPSKPPLYAWWSSLATVATGSLNPLTLYFPSVLSTLLLSCLVYVAGKKNFGPRAGFLAGLVLLLSFGIIKQMPACRHDGLFTLGISLAAIAAFNSWLSGRNWIWFWLAATIATLTKGPLGLALAAGGLLAVFWEKISGEPIPLKGKQLPGIIFFLLIAGGWFALAYWQTNGAIVDRMIFKELLGHAVTNDDGDPAGSGFYKPTFTFLGNFAPWSMLTGLALWRIWKKPSADSHERRFERFLFCWFIVSLIIFSLAAHQRGRLIIPLFPVGALLAGRELARLTKAMNSMKFSQTCSALTLVGLLAVGFCYHFIASKSRGVVRTQGMRQLAQEVREKLGDDFPLIEVDSPYPFQFYTKRLRPMTPLNQAIELLQGDTPAFVAVSSLEKMKKKSARLLTNLYELARWPEQGEPLLTIVGNRPKLESQVGAK